MMDVEVRGLSDLRRELAGLVPKLRFRAIRSALTAGLRIVQRATRAAVPVIAASHPSVRRGWRKPGTVRKALSVRFSVRDYRAGNVGVFLNVRPAEGAKFKTRRKNVAGLIITRRTLTKASQRGAKNPNDPFYWRWLQFGTKPRTKGERSSYVSRGKLRTRKHSKTTGGIKAYKFLEAGAAKFPQALVAFNAAMVKSIAKLNRPKAPPP